MASIPAGQPYTPRPDSTRVFVQLSSSTRILVPVPEQSTVRDLHQKTLQRAAGFAVRGTLDDTVLETTGSTRPPVALYGEDLVLDILDLTEDNTFSLRTINLEQEGREAAAAPGPSTGPGIASSVGKATPPPPVEDERMTDDDDGLVYVRWVTVNAAVENSRLSSIPVDDAAFPPETILADFYRIAKERLCSRSPRGSCTNPQGLNLYLKECYLNAEKNPASLVDLELKGGSAAPLDIFVEFVGPEENRGTLQQLSQDSEPSTLWSIDSTKRGICTLVTSLQILLKEIERGNCTLDGVLKVLLELTHFPPLLLAFSHIHHRRLEESSDAGPFLLVASAFHALCRKLVPSWICPTSDMALEASRQLVAWIFSMHSSEKLPCLVHRVQIKQATDDGLVASAMQYAHDLLVPLPFESTEAGDTRDVHVGLDENDKNLSRVLSLALLDKYSEPWDFYFGHPTISWKEFLGHWLMPTLDQNEFHHLLETTNSIGAFRMVGPQQLGTCLAAEIPVITLSPSGYVSRYDQEDFGCGQRRFYIWNALEKKVTLPDLDSGQFLSHKLEPVIAERKKAQTWELDSWAQWNEATNFGTPDEAVVICVDTSQSMSTAMRGSWTATRDGLGGQASRLTEVKEFFKNFALRISALNLSTYLGLVTFSDSVTEWQALTPLHLNIHHQLEHIKAQGMTAIFDAISRATAMLLDLKTRLPETKCRIVLLTDGEDNKSTTIPSAASQALYDNDIVLDSVVIGSDVTTNLFRMARMTGGYAFAPKTQQAFFQIFLLETAVDIRTRPEPVKVSLEKHTWTTFSPKAEDMSNPYEFPPCKPHPHMDDYFIALRDAERFLAFLSRRPNPSFETVVSDSIRSSVPTGMTGRAAGSGNTSSARILMSEVKAMIEHPHDFMDVYVSEGNMGFWKVVLQGPPASAYQDGVFLLYVEIGSGFPRTPPTARFVTPVLHPNITKVCHLFAVIYIYN